MQREGPKVGVRGPPSQSIAQKGVRIIAARNSQLENGSNAAKASVRAPGCQRMSVNTLLCDTLGLAECCFSSLIFSLLMIRDCETPGVRTPRVFISCHPDPPPKPPMPPPQTCPCRSLHPSPWYYALLYIPMQGGEFLWVLGGGVFWGRELSAPRHRIR